MFATRAARYTAATFSLVAALLWAFYYFFVLALAPRVAPSALLPYPFLIGGAGYLVWTLRAGHGAVVLQLFRDPAAWLRVALIIAMQLSILAATYTAGPVDTSLLSLVGDVVLTPFLVMWLYGDGRDRTRSPFFLGGVLLSLAGASLTILAGGSAGPLRGWAVVVAPIVPFSVAFYFILSARESIRKPTTAVVGQATFVGGLVGLVVAGIVPGGWAGLVVVDPLSWLLIAGLGLTSFFVAAALYFAAVERAGFILPVLLMATIPVFTLLLSDILLGAVPPLLGIIGVPIAVAGGLLALEGTHVPWTPRYRRLTPASVSAPGAEGTRSELPDGSGSRVKTP